LRSTRTSSLPTGNESTGGNGPPVVVDDDDDDDDEDDILMAVVVVNESFEVAIDGMDVDEGNCNDGIAAAAASIV
jgi:hypothetical protein